MKFAPTDDQLEFAKAIDDIAGAHGGPAVARAWAEGETTAGTALWEQFAQTGVLGLRIEETDGGLGGSPADMVMVFERLGYHAVPGPYIESAVLAPRLVSASLREQVAEGTAILTASVDNLVPFAQDAYTSTHAFIVSAEAITPARPIGTLHSIDPSRALGRLEPTGPLETIDRALVSAAIEESTLASAAQLVGAGERLLDEAVAYAKLREQFGHPIGEYQAIKHALANVRVALTFARPLVHAAALDLGSPTTSRSVSAAKVAAAEAALLAARVALQVHGAIGYTAEYDLSLWLLRVRATIGLWGTPAYHRARIAASLLAGTE